MKSQCSRSSAGSDSSSRLLGVFISLFPHWTACLGVHSSPYSSTRTTTQQNNPPRRSTAHHLLRQYMYGIPRQTWYARLVWSCCVNVLNLKLIFCFLSMRIMRDCERYFWQFDFINTSQLAISSSPANWKKCHRDLIREWAQLKRSTRLMTFALLSQKVQE